MFQKSLKTHIGLNLHQIFSSSRLIVLAIGILFTTFSTVISAQSDQYKQAYSAYQTQDFITAGRIWEELANQGDINAQYALGVMQLRGETENPNQEEAFRRFKQAAAQGHSTAMFNVGVAFWEGSGINQDREQALKWWEQSANAGDSGAQFNLGLAYYIGEERPADLTQAAKWIGLAAKQNHPEAKRIYKILTTENPDLIQSEGDENSLATLDNSSNSNTTTGSGSNTTNSLQQAEVEEVSLASSTTGSIVDTILYWRTTDNAELHVAPQSSSMVFTSLPVGTPVEIIVTRGDWTLVTLPAGLKVWAFESFLEINGDRGVIKGTGVRVRPQPSTDNASSPPIGAYRNGDRVAILSQQDSWYQVRAPKHIGGWIASKNLESYKDTKENRESLWETMIAKGL